VKKGYPEKAKLFVRRGRKVTGLAIVKTAGLPKGKQAARFFCAREQERAG